MSRLSEIPGRLYRGEVSVNFVDRRRLWYAISGLILLISIVSLLVRGLDFSVEFKGGADFQISRASASLTVGDVQQAATAGGVSDAIVQQVGAASKGSWQVQTKALNEAQTTTMQDTLAKDLGVTVNDISVTSVGASWGGQITDKAVQALIAFLIVIVIYLSIAFEWKMAVAAFVALLHDLVITIGVYSLTGLEISPASVIGFLTILGYSLYDTVVVFDKVRENTAGLLGGARNTYSQAANLALNQTLVRSINTSLIALLPVGAILVVSSSLLAPGNELEDLALVLFVGMLSGTYSSIFIATPVLAQLKEREPQYKSLTKRVATRASGGRVATRKTAAKAGSGASRGSVAAPLGVPPAASGDDGIRDFDDQSAAPDDDLIQDDVPSSAGLGGRVQAGHSYTMGPRQQPRRDGRSSTARRRPAGKKKRR